MLFWFGLVKWFTLLDAVLCTIRFIIYSIIIIINNDANIYSI